MLLVNKPTGITSHDVVDAVRRVTGERRVGHAGTLDPFAEGLLIILVGRVETKRQGEFLGLSKVYETTFVLGEERDTDDVTGKVRPASPKTTSRDGQIANGKSQMAEKEKGRITMPTGRQVEKEEIEDALKKFVGEMDQMPPPYSAKKIKGKKAYELAREGIEPELKPKRITIHELELTKYEWPELSIRTHVSSGTYIRALARDIGRELGVGAYVKTLKRTSIGEYTLAEAVDLDQI